ncbi:MAG: hypothetical protein GY870_04345 [archaeon]|nr:hypothetical protein [archaeon]
MKKTIYLLLPILLMSLLIVFPFEKKTETKKIEKSNESLRIIAKFELKPEDVGFDETLTISV